MIVRSSPTGVWPRKGAEYSPFVDQPPGSDSWRPPGDMCERQWSPPKGVVRRTDSHVFDALFETKKIPLAKNGQTLDSNLRKPTFVLCWMLMLKLQGDHSVSGAFFACYSSW